MTVQFRILNDELSGASLDIEEGLVYRVGNSFDFDVYLGSLNQNEGTCYFEFSIQSDKLIFTKASNNITNINYTNQIRALIDLGLENELPGLFEFSGIKFALCDPNDSWETWTNLANAKQESLNQQNLDEPVMTEEEKSEIEQLTLKSKNLSNIQNIPSPLLKQILAFLKSKGLDPAVFINLSAKSKKILILSCFASFFLVVVAVAFTQIQKYAAEHAKIAKQTSTIEDMQAIKQIEVNLPTHFNTLKFLSNKTDLVIIEGVVKNAEEVNFIRSKFDKYKNIIQFKILTSEEAIRKLNSILKAQNAPLVKPFFNNDTYRLYLAGLLSNLDAINDIELAVSNQLPEVSDMDTSQVYSISDVERDIDELFSRNNLSTRLAIKKDLNNREVYISGYLLQKEINDLNNNAADVMQKYQGLIKININVRDALNSLPFKIVAVNTSGFPSFMTDDGQKVFEGGEINGMKVDRITPTEIAFSGKFPLVIKLDDAFNVGNNDQVKPSNIKK